MTVVLLIPSFLDSLRVVFGIRLMSLFAVSLCLVAWLTKALSARKFAIQPSSLYFLLLLLGVASFLSVTSPIGSPFAKLYRAASFFYTRLLIVFLLINFIRTLDQVRRTMYLVIGLGAFSALIALWQFWMYQQTGLNYSFAQDEQTFRVTSEGTFLRATALAADPNEIGINMAVVGTWCLYLGLATRGFRPLVRVVHYLAFLILAGGVIVTFSRSALLSLLIAAIMVYVTAAVLTRPPWSHGIAALLGASVLGSVMIGGLLDLPQIFGVVPEDVLWRIDLNRIGVRAILENPLTGVGVDAFTNYDNPYDLAVHNLFIQIAAEMGIPGLLVFTILVGSVGVRLVIAAWQSSDSRIRTVLAALTLGYGAKLLSHMSTPILTDLLFWYYVGLSEAALAVYRSGNTNGDGAVDRRRQ